MRQMVFYGPRDLRYDTSVPQRCAASDLELAVRGAAACPPGSRLGGGNTDSAFLGRFPSTVQADFFNNTDEQIILIRSPGVSTVARGTIHPDGTIEWASPTCFPSIQPVACPVDTALQLKTSMTVPPYTNSSGSYMTTPPDCPATGHWDTTVRLWWADATVDTVVTQQQCTPGVA